MAGAIPPAREPDVERLGLVLPERSILRGRLTLASARTSEHSIGCRKTTLDPEEANLVGRRIFCLFDQERIRPAAVGGLTMAADPVATAVVARIDREEGGAVTLPKSRSFPFFRARDLR